MRWDRRRRDEAGAVVATVAILSMVLVLVAAFAVDLGMQRVARRDMQALADVVALDLARLTGQRTESELDAIAPAEIAESVARNKDTIGAKPTVTAQFGEVDETTGAFRPVPAGQLPTAVRVQASTEVGFAFAPGSGAAGRSAVAVADNGACFSVGSYAARVATGDSWILHPLLSVLGTSAGLTVLDLQGLADLDLTALDLLGTDLGAGGYDELLTTSVTLRQLYLAMADVLRARGGQTAQVALLHRLASVGVSSLRLRLADLVDLETAGQAGLSAGLNVLDLVVAGAFVANGTNAIAIPAVGVTVPGVTDLRVSAHVAQRPVVACGRAGATEATSSQVELRIHGNLVDVDLGLAEIRAPITISLALDPATVRLRELECAGTRRTLRMDGLSGLLDLQVLVGDQVDRSALKVAATGITIANGFIEVRGARHPAQAQSGTIVVDGDDYDGAPVFTLGSRSVGLPALSATSHLTLLPGTGIGELVSGLLGGIVNGIVNPLLSVVLNPLLQGLDRGLLSPLLSSLGINLTGADVPATPAVRCGEPALRG